MHQILYNRTTLGKAIECGPLGVTWGPCEGQRIGKCSEEGKPDDCLEAEGSKPAMFFKLFDLIGEEVCNINKSKMFIVI